MTDDVEHILSTLHRLGQHRRLDHRVCREQLAEIFLVCVGFDCDAEWMFRHDISCLCCGRLMSSFTAAAAYVRQT